MGIIFHDFLWFEGTKSGLFHPPPQNYYSLAEFSAPIRFYLSEVKGPVIDKLATIGFVDYLGKDHIFLTTDQAMQALAEI
jgi:hypothetical protein